MKIVRLIFMLAIAAQLLPISMGNLTLTKVMGIVVTVTTIAVLYIKKAKPQFDGMAFLLLFLVFALGMMGQYGYGHMDWFHAQKMLLNLLFMFIIMQYVRTPNDVITVFSAYLIAGSIAIASGYSSSYAESDQRIAGLILNATGYGQVCAQTAILAFGLLLYWKARFKRLLLGGVMFGALIGLLYSASRGATLALLGAAAVLFTLRGRKRQVVLLIALFAIAVQSLAPAYFFERFAWAFHSKGGYKQSGIDIRANLAQHGIRIFMDHPIVGVGMGNVRWAMKERIGIAAVTHNAFTQVLAETGLGGFLCFLILVLRSGLFAYGRATHRQSDPDHRAIFSTLLAFIVVVVIGGVSSGNYLHFQWFLIFGIVGGLTVSGRQRAAQQAKARLQAAGGTLRA